MKRQQQLWLLSIWIAHEINARMKHKKKYTQNNTVPNEKQKIHLGNSCWNVEPTTLTATNSSSRGEKKTYRNSIFSHNIRNVQRRFALNRFYHIISIFCFSFFFSGRRLVCACNNNVMNHFYDLGILCPRIMIVIRQMVLVQFYTLSHSVCHFHKFYLKKK